MEKMMEKMMKQMENYSKFVEVQTHLNFQEPFIFNREAYYSIHRAIRIHGVDMDYWANNAKKRKAIKKVIEVIMARKSGWVPKVIHYKIAKSFQSKR